MSNTKLAPTPCAGDTTAVLLAAGHGKRMLPLTKHMPKPLLKVGQHSLIEHHLLALKQQGFQHVVINLAYLGDQIHDQLGDGASYGLTIEYSDESNSGALETAGGLRHALSIIQSDPFLVINADIWTDYQFASLLAPLERPDRKTPGHSPVQPAVLGRLVMVANPSHNTEGDFALEPSGLLSSSNASKLTFSGIALYRRAMFDNLDEGKQALSPIFRQLIAQQALLGEHYQGNWTDVGTPERLRQLNAQVND